VLLRGFLALALTTAQSTGSPGSCTLYDGRAAGGASVHVTGDVPDLSILHNFDNKISSVCMTGLWFFYNDINYNTQKTTNVLYNHGLDFCLNMPQIMDNRISSLRFGGRTDSLDAPSFSLFAGEEFQGDKFQGLRDYPSLGSLSGRASSLLITGPQAWTFYTGEDYTGSAFCVRPDITDRKGAQETHYKFIEKMDARYANKLQSAKLGCHSEALSKQTRPQEEGILTCLRTFFFGGGVLTVGRPSAVV